MVPVERLFNPFTPTEVLNDRKNELIVDLKIPCAPYVAQSYYHFPSGDDGVFTIGAFIGDPTREMTLHVDQYSGEKLMDIRYSQYGIVPKLVEYGIALHQGQLFGFLNQLVCLLICLLILAICVSGAVMWWKRRPPGKLAAPGAVSDAPLWRTACVLIAFMGLVRRCMKNQRSRTTEKKGKA